MPEKKNGGWFSTFLCVGCLIPMFVASVDLSAAPRFWTLTGVQFARGGVATGTIGFDDDTQTFTTWNVRVSDGPEFYAFTYVPGNSSQSVWTSYEKYPTLWFQSDLGGEWAYERHLLIQTLVPLDGSNATVPIVVKSGYDYSFEGAGAAWGFSRGIVAGALTLAPPPPPATIVQVDEFHHPVSGHYFMTADAGEMHDLDAGVHPGWVRTGESFKTYATAANASGSINPVCRYYRNPLRGLVSHFYSADAAECASIYGSPDWLYESDNVFQANLPDKGTGVCPGGTIPVYRLWNQRVDSNHRYTTNPSIKQQMRAMGYVPEGYGADGVAMCAVN